MDCIDEIVAWTAEKLAPWKQDAMRRIACSESLTAEDQSELLAMLKKHVGFDIEAGDALALERAHFSAPSASAPFHIKKIHKVTNVNRLVPAAELNFSPVGLTIIYGRNGSGKSGFVRIFRTACRTRIENAAKLKVLGDVYDVANLPLSAEIVVEKSGTDVPILWESERSASTELSQVAVFDAAAAQVYVDSGHHIQFLPFGLALPHKLNELCLQLKSTLENEKRPVAEKIALLTVPFQEHRSTRAQSFYTKLNGRTTEADIDAAATFSDEDQARLEELNRLLGTPGTSATDVASLSLWASQLGDRSGELITALNDDQLQAYDQLRQTAVAARQLANLSAEDLFTDEPLQGVGADAWRILWQAARNYSTSDAYRDRPFPVVSDAENKEHCVLCQQELDDTASIRLAKFGSFMTGTLASDAALAEANVAQFISAMPDFGTFDADDWTAKLAHIINRDAELAARILDFKVQIVERREHALKTLRGAAPDKKTFQKLDPIAEGLEKLTEALKTEAESLKSLAENTERQKLINERNELEDKKVLSLAVSTLKSKASNLALEALYVAAVAEVQTAAITKKANDLIDKYLTEEVIDAFKRERADLDINGLKIALSRRSDQKRASFQTEPGTALVKNSSDILSEGEQRALALAGFFTEVTISAGNGPIVIDDPVSSLDRDRGMLVAKRIARESQVRQVIVFTHDLVFFNELYNETDALGVPVQTLALFSDAKNAGRIDRGGISWKGLAVSRRLTKIRDEFNSIKSLHGTSPTQYEFEVKNLYGRLRDTYERLVEEYIFHDIVRRGVDAVQTLKLRHVHLTDTLAIKFYDGMTKANTHSHDNPASDTVPVPAPTEFQADLIYIETLINELKIEAKATEARRPSMR